MCIGEFARRPPFSDSIASVESIEAADSASRRMCRHKTLNRDQAAKAFSTALG
jgi:hypothetical protein